MDIEFVINDYLLAWYLLFKPSFCEEVQNLKERLWKVYRTQYTNMQKENIEILKYNKDFIPDDDTLYNLVFESDVFIRLKDKTEKLKHKLLEVWDKNSKKIDAELKEILRLKEIQKYTILLVSPEIDVVEYVKSNPKKNISWGRGGIDDALEILINIVYMIIRCEIGEPQKESKEITTAIIDLAITNELYTRVCGISKYLLGNKKLRLLRKQIYPYWLMYLGCDKEELVTYMMRDKIAFDIDKYTIEKGLKKVDIYGFIDFCCKNQKYIIRLEDLVI